MWNFFIGIFIGGTIGFFLAALCNMTSKNDTDYMPYGENNMNGDTE